MHSAVSPTQLSVVLKSLWDLLFPCPSFCDSLPRPPKANGALPSKVKENVLNKSDKATIWDLLKGSLSLAEVGQCHGENESNVHSTALNSVHPEQARTFWSHRPVDTKGHCVHLLGWILTSTKRPSPPSPSLWLKLRVLEKHVHGFTACGWQAAPLRPSSGFQPLPSFQL
jgi:hypothetical protein